MHNLQTRWRRSLRRAGVVAALRAGGRREVFLMSGDSRSVAEAIAERLGVDRVMSELMPEDKARHVRALQREGRVVAMVGDGINDAPALALADVGISLHGGSEVALDTADVVLVDGGLSKLPRAFELADDAMKHGADGTGDHPGSEPNHRPVAQAPRWAAADRCVEARGSEKGLAIA